MSSIARVHGRQILDSRGNPTVEVDVELESGALGRAAVPSGASTGVHEAVELRDGGAALRRQGRHARRSRTSTARSPARSRARRARPGARSTGADRARRHAEQGPARRERDPRRLARRREGRGGRGGAAALPLSRRRRRATTLPVPMMNVINGGAHADNSIDLQEFMVVPVGADTFAEALRIGARGLPRAEAGARTSAGSRPPSATRAASRPTSSRARRRSRRSSRRSSGPATATASRSRSTRRRPSSSRDGVYRFEGREHDERRDGRVLGRARRALPDRLDRGRARRGRLGRLGAADERARRARPARRRRPLRHEPGAAAAGHRARRRATRSWSR